MLAFNYLCCISFVVFNSIIMFAFDFYSAVSILICLFVQIFLELLLQYCYTFHMLAFNYLCCISFVVFNSIIMFAFDFYSAVSILICLFVQIFLELLLQYCCTFHMLAFNYLCCICYVVFNSTFIFAFHFYSAVSDPNLSLHANVYRIPFTILLYFSHILAYYSLCCICFVVFNSNFVFAFDFYSAVCCTFVYECLFMYFLLTAITRCILCVTNFARFAVFTAPVIHVGQHKLLTQVLGLPFNFTTSKTLEQTMSENICHWLRFF